MDPESSTVLSTDDPQPTKTGLKTGYQTINGHISQIPGLSPSISTLPEERAQGRRVKVLESDSDYVKLAKQGGHKGLLWHEDIMSNSILNSYKAPDWFGSALEDDGKPSEEKKSPGAFQPLEPPFGTDNMSAWERDDSNSNSNDKKKDNVQVQNSQMEKVQTSNQHPHITKFRRITFEKKQAPAEMSKLLSFGYADGNTPVQ